MKIPPKINQAIQNYVLKNIQILNAKHSLELQSSHILDELLDSFSIVEQEEKEGEEIKSADNLQEIWRGNAFNSITDLTKTAEYQRSKNGMEARNTQD